MSYIRYILVLAVLFHGCEFDLEGSMASEDFDEEFDGEKYAASEIAPHQEKAMAIGNVACFDWSCDSSTRICTFDTSCSIINEGSLWRHSWSFGDGTSQLVGPECTEHQYGDQASATVTLQLALYGSYAMSTVTCGIQIRSVIGPPVPTWWGRCKGHEMIALTPTADAYVAQNYPNNNFGASSELRIRHTATGRGRYSFLKFQVPTITDFFSATLQLRTKSTPIPAAAIYRVDNINNWSETGITWNNWASGGATYTYLGSLANLAANTWRPFSLPGSISSGPKTFGITTSVDQGGLDFYSRETSSRPRLEILFGQPEYSYDYPANNCSSGSR